MMTTYFHGGSEIQAAGAAGGGGDNLQTLYLMNPNYIAAYSNESPHNHHHHNNQTSPNMLFLNHPSAGGAPPNALAQGSIAHASHPAQQQLIGIPFAGPHSENNPGRPSSSSSLQGHDPSHHHQISSSLHGLAVSRVHYNLWSPTVDPSPTHTQPGPIQTVTVAGHADVDGFCRPPAGGTGAQGLSLSLSPHHHQHQNSGAVIGGGGDDGRMSVTVSNGVQGVILGSKCLKAAQELLDEVVNVGNYKDLNNTNDKSGGPHKNKAKAATSPAGERLSGGGEGSSSGSKRPAEQLTTAQRQELQMKKAKLLNMLDEVDQRYRQYHSQMQVVVSSFENASGIGSAKSYTSLALQTISKQFRCLKDAITSQIKATNKSLGEEDSNGGPGVKLEGGAGSRLRFVDHQLRQQRALQQLGMMQHNAWRPQRGLPERAVSVLRAWLFEHFLHPYPKDSDKHMLAKQTGLTRSQVSNWFINARVRLWKPMVEEMYTEEMKAQEQNGGTSEDNNNTTTPKNDSTHPSNEQDNDQSICKTTTTIVPQQHEHHTTTIIQPHHHHHHHHHHQHPDHTITDDMISNMSTTPSQGFTLIGSSSDMESLMARSPKKQRSGSDIQNSPSSILSMDMEMKPPDNSTGFNPYIVHDMGRFNPDQLAGHPYHGNNGVSLTLGLPHCDNLSLSGNHHQQNFIPSQGIRLEIGAHGEGADFCGISMGQPSHPANGYESIDLQSRKRFAA